jgi:transcriptional regulator with XRE-family HTH domain
MKYDIARIRKERILKGWSQTQLARAVGLHVSSVSLIERGKISGMPGTLKTICEVLGIPMEEILIEEVERSA